MTDIVERLRQIGDWIEPKVWEHHPTAWEAADEIERLRAALIRIVNLTEGIDELGRARDIANAAPGGEEQ